MLTLTSHSLRVDLLDPVDAIDRIHLGTRYCWGGYIWQVTDLRAGPLFAGAQWPEPNPRPFNGQGLPESFRSAEFGTGRALILENRRGFIIGIGHVEPHSSADGELVVTEPCAWTVTRHGNTFEFCTSQSGNGYACQLTRRVTLADRTLTSATSLTNIGSRPLPLHWFAHPFFSLSDRMLTCSLPASWALPDNAGYTLDAARRITFKRRFNSIDDGVFQQLTVGANTPLRSVLSHPQLSEIVFTTDFTPDSCPIWGNCNTWSIEPYIATDLAVGASRKWSLSYQLGDVAPR